MRRLTRTSLYFGTLACVLGMGRLHAYRHQYSFHGSSRFGWSLAYVVSLCVAAYALGLPDLVRRQRAAWATALAATAFGAVGVSVAQLIAGTAVLPRFVVFGSALLLVPWYVACTAVSSGGRQREEGRDRAALVGESEDERILRRELASGPERDATLVATLTVKEACGSGKSKPLTEVVIRERATVVVLSRTAQVDESIVDQAATLHEAGLRVRTLSGFYEEWLGKLPLSELERISLMFDVGELHRVRYGRVKRLVDLMAATIGLLPLAAMTLVVGVCNLVGNRGKLFYRQDRVGRFGRQFSIVKFRTMRSVADAASEWTRQGDPRITPFGRLLRRSHIDELPQIWNILRGDLSLVGPRPEQPAYVRELLGEIPFYGLRHLVRPGLTGWAQVKYGYASDESDALEKLQYDFYYLEHQDILFDLRIIGRTLRSVVRLGGR